MACGWLLLCAGASAVEYVVATNGLDSHDGLSEVAPFRTIQHALDVVAPGDVVKVRKGTYREFLDATTAGTEGAPIALEAYPGEVPVIKGSQVLTNWTPHGSTVWAYTNWPHRSQQVFVDGVPLQQIGVPYPGSTEIDYFPVGLGLADLTAGSFYYDSTQAVLYVWLPDGGSPAGRTIEAGAAFLPLVRTAERYVLNGLHIQHANVLGFHAAVQLGAHSTITSCDIRWNDSVGLTFGNNATVVSNVLAHNGRLGMSAVATNLYIAHNQVVSNNVRGFHVSNHAGGIKLLFQCSGIIEDNTFEGNYGSGLWIDYNRLNALMIRRNFFQRNHAALREPTYGQAALFIEMSRRITLANNLLVDNDYDGILIGESDEVQVLNNTVAGTRGYAALAARIGYRIVATNDLGITIPDQGQPGTFTSNRLANNLLVDNETLIELAWPTDETTGLVRVEGNASDHNLFHRSGPAGTFSSLLTGSSTNLAGYVALTGFDAHSLAADPLLLDAPGGDYRLSYQSPAINTGDTSFAEIGTLDFAGRERVRFGAVDIGCHEFDGDAAALVPTVSITTRGTVGYDTLHAVGDNNGNVVGTLWAAYAWGTASGTAPVTRLTSSTWIFDALELPVGEACTLWVYGSNAYETVAADTSVVTRAGLGTGAPFLAITNEGPLYLPTATSQQVSGTNNLHVMPVMYWSNTYNGTFIGGGVFTAANSRWDASVTGLLGGRNIIHVFGTNQWGETTSAQLLVEQGETLQHFVDLNAPDPQFPYTSWEHAALTIHDALEVASDGDEVIVAPGTYNAGYNETDYGYARAVLDRGIHLRARDGASNTIIQGYVPGGIPGMRGAILMHTNAQLSGFTIHQGRTPGRGTPEIVRHGGGVLAVAMRAVRDCTIQHCEARPYGIGGGLYAESSGGVLERITAVSNVAGYAGGIALNLGGGAVIRNCTVRGNRALYDCGGLLIDNTFEAYNCLVVDNEAEGGGGGGVSIANNAAAWNFTIEGNRALYAGAVHFSGNKAFLYNSTLSSNTLPAVSAASNVNHSIFHSFVPQTSGVNLTYIGCSTNDPQYTDIAAGDYRPSASSPARDAGTTGAWQAAATDLDGAARVTGPAIDCGAYEYWSNVWLTLQGAGYTPATTNLVTLDLAWAPDRSLTIGHLALTLPAGWSVAFLTGTVSAAYDAGQGLLFPAALTGGAARVELQLAVPASQTGLQQIAFAGPATLSAQPQDAALTIGPETLDLPRFHWLDLSASGEGTLSTSDAWYAPGSTVTIAATAAAGWRLRGWLGDTAGAVTNANGSLTVVLDATRAITADFVELVALQIFSEHAAVAPASGVHIVDRGSRVSFAAAGIATNGGITYAVSSWTGSGSVPASGTAKRFSIVIDGDSSITWTWTAIGATHRSRGYRVAGTARASLDVELACPPLSSIAQIWYRPTLATNERITAVSGAGAPTVVDGLYVAAAPDASGRTALTLELDLAPSPAAPRALEGAMGLNGLPEEPELVW